MHEKKNWSLKYTVEYYHMTYIKKTKKYKLKRSVDKSKLELRLSYT